MTKSVVVLQARHRRARRRLRELTRGRRGGRWRSLGHQQEARWRLLGPFGGWRSRGFRASCRRPWLARRPHP